MHPNHPYTITFPIWKCPQWSALRGRLKLTDEQIVVSRWNDTTYLDEELKFLEQQYRIKPQIEGKPIKPQQNLLPSILQVIRTNTYTDLILDNCQQWQLGTGDLSKLLLIYFGYDQYQGMPSRDCTIENIIRNGDSIVIVDFGLRKRTEKYCVYWNPLILKGRSFQNSYQWSLGIIYLVMTQGGFILNEVHKLVAEWLKGARLDVSALLTSKKQSICSLITMLLNPENPIPWDQIPHHAAFREDAVCKQLLKEFDVRSFTDVRIRSTSRGRLSSRNSSPTIMPNPTGRRSSFFTESITANQSLITKVSNHYQLHKEKVTAAVQPTKSSSQGKIILKIQSSKFQNYFSTTKISPKLNKQNEGEKVQKSQRNVSQNTSNNFFNMQEEDTTRLRGGDSTHLAQRKLSQVTLKDEARQSQTELRQRNRGPSIKTGSQTSIIELNLEKLELKPGEVKRYPSFEEIQAKYKNKASSQTSLDLQTEPPIESQQDDITAENYIQLIKRPTQQIEYFLKQFSFGLEIINLVGQTVAKCLEYLNGLQNFWVIPLFLVFKRMYQLRLECQQILVDKVNIFDIPFWSDITESLPYLQFQRKVESDNELVLNELNLLLKASTNKADRLDVQRREKVAWFLNDDVNDEITEICVTYFHGQIYKSVQERKGIHRPLIDWLKLQVQVQVSIIILKLPTLKYESLNYESYLDIITQSEADKFKEFTKIWDERIQSQLERQIIKSV